MNINNIKHIIKNTLTKNFLILKGLKTLPFFWMYILLSVILTIIFLIFTFPYDVLIKKQLQTIGSNIGKSASIGEIDFSLIGNSKIDNISVILKNESEITIQDINIDINLLRLLLGDNVKGNADIKNFKYEKDKLLVNLNASSDISLDFDSFADYPEGKIKLELKNAIANGITIKGFNIPPVKFTSINADLNFQKKRMNIDDLKFTGPDLKGGISGYIMLAKFFGQSQLNLNITLLPTSTMIENYKILLENWMDESNNIKLTIKGTVANPMFDSNSTSRQESNSNSTSRFGQTKGSNNNSN